MKMSSFFVVVTLVVIIWLVIKWFLKMLASLAWLITIVFVTMVRGGDVKYFIFTFYEMNHEILYLNCIPPVHFTGSSGGEFGRLYDNCWKRFLFDVY